MTPFDERNRQEGAKPFYPSADRSKVRKGGGPRREAEDSLDREWRWLWGAHAVKAALGNPARQIDQILLTRNALAELPEELLVLPDRPAPQIAEPRHIAMQLPEGAVHQGFGIHVHDLPPADLYTAAGGRGMVLVLDQITDPQNIGAIFRAAAAFEVRLIVLQDRKSPPFTGFVAKAAAGGLERVPFTRVVNIARSIVALREAGFRAIGLASEGGMPLADALAPAGPPASPRPLALVLGAEGKGLRPLVAESCDALARIPIAPQMESLNVAGAAAIALYEGARSARK